MLEYDRIVVSESIDTNKTDGLRECIIYHYWYVLKINLDFKQEYVMVAIIWHKNPRVFMTSQFLLLEEMIIGFFFGLCVAMKQ